MSKRKKSDRSTSPKISMPAKPRYKLGQSPAFLQAMAEAGNIPPEEIALAFIDLRRRIATEFPLSPAPAYRLANALVDDAWGQVDEAFPDDWQEESWSDWSEISDEQIALCPGFFCFAPPEVSPYYTPRWMLWVLDAIEGRHSLDSPVWRAVHLVAPATTRQTMAEIRFFGDSNRSLGRLSQPDQKRP